MRAQKKSSQGICAWLRRSGSVPALIAEEEEGDGAGARVGTDRGADRVDEDFPFHLGESFLDEFGDRLGEFGAGGHGDVNLAITRVGCTVDQLELTETRMSNQQETIMELQSSNDDLDISEIIMNYTAAYNAYQSSLTAAGKLSGMTLLNYI